MAELDLVGLDGAEQGIEFEAGDLVAIDADFLAPLVEQTDPVGKCADFCYFAGHEITPNLVERRRSRRLGFGSARAKGAHASRTMVYFALNSAGRFSTYAASPSFASSLWKSNCWFSRSTASADSSGISQPVCTERLIRPTALAALFGGQNWRAYSITFSMKPSRS